MAINYRTFNVLAGTADVAVGASATETVVVPNLEITGPDSLNFKIRLVCSAIKEITGISWKLQHSWDKGSTWEDVNRGGALATVSIASDTCADAAVDTGDDHCTLTSHPFETGDAVSYTSSAGNVITGLADDTVYYVIKVDANDIRLATTYANAIAGTAITLTQPAGGDTHYFTKVESELSLNVDNSTDEPALPLYPVVRVVATTGANDIFTVSDAWVARREY